MSRKRFLKTTGASTKHSKGRLVKQCGFKGDDKEAKRFIGLCRRKAGKNDNLILSAENLGVSKKQMIRWGIPDDKYYISFVRGRAPTILSLCVFH